VGVVVNDDVRYASTCASGFFAASKFRPDARGEFFAAERLREVVVATDYEASNLVTD